jgi:hypothetical protein
MSKEAFNKFENVILKTYNMVEDVNNDNKFKQSF